MTADQGTLVGIAGIILSFGVAALFFRIQREISMKEVGEIVWLPLADWLLVIASGLCLILVIIPILFASQSRFAAPACSAALVLVLGYIPAIMGHYRFLFDVDLRGRQRSGSRTNPEPSELVFVLLSLIGAGVIFALTPKM